MATIVGIGKVIRDFVTPSFLLHFSDDRGIMLRIAADGTIYGPVSAHSVRFVRTLIAGTRQVGTVRSVLGVWTDRTDGRAASTKDSAQYRTLFAAIERDPRCKLYDERHPESAPIAPKIIESVKARYNVG